MSIKPKKYLGQHFLHDQSIIHQIIDLAKLNNATDVIEIGPGQGALTKELIKFSKSVVAYELDRDLINHLKSSLPSKNLEIINKDFLKVELDWKGKKTVVANIPYYITSDILFKLFESADLFDEAILMIQKEVALRLCAKTGNTNYGKLTIACKYFADVHIGINVLSTSFTPPPKVDSSVVVLKFKKRLFNNKEQKKFLLFVKNCFAMRRKKLSNNLKKINLKLTDQQLSKLGLTENTRPQEVSFEKYIQLFNMFQ